jgi:hypothetical protein
MAIKLVLGLRLDIWWDAAIGWDWEEDCDE